MNMLNKLDRFGLSIDQYVNDQSWQENVLKALEHKNTEGDSLLEMMEQETHQFINTHKLQALLQWAAQVTNDSQEQFKPSAKRAEALAIALDRAIDLAHAHARDADRFLARECADNLIQAHMHACDIVRKLEHTAFAAETAEGQASELCPTFTDRVVETWYSGLFDPKLVDLSKQETQALKDYLSANALLIRFKELVVGLSDDCWQTIERQMLLI